MKRLFAWLLLSALAVLLCGCTATMEALPTMPPEATALHTFSPVSTPIPYSSRGLPRVLPEMETADYWISLLEAPDALLADADTIEAAIAENCLNTAETHMYDMLAFPETMSAGELQATLDAVLQADYSGYCSPGREINTDFYTELYNAMSPETLPENPEAAVAVRWGVAVEAAMIRSYPSALQLLDSPEDVKFDNFDLSTLYPGEPVAVLHTSSDGEWYYIANAQLTGWVDSFSVGITDRETYLRFAAPEKPCVVTAASVTVESSTLPMGTVLPLTAEGLLLPERDEAGELICLPLSRLPEGFHQGYLPLTRRNLLTQAFMLLDTPYGWGGRDGMDCSQFTAAVYRCCGMQLARNTSWQPLCRGDKVNLEGLDPSQRMEALERLGPGALVYMRGHVVLYLGTAEGRPYAIHSLYSWSEDGSTKQICGYVAVSDMLIRRPSNGLTHLESYWLALMPG